MENNSFIIYVVVLAAILAGLLTDYVLYTCGLPTISEIASKSYIVGVCIIMLHATLPVLLCIHFYYV